MITISTADKALKDYYLDVVTDQLESGANPFLNMIEKTSDNVFGKDVKKIATFGLNGGISAGTETGDLPKSSGNNYAEFVLSLKNLYGTIEISDKALRASENNSGAVVNLLNAEMEGLLKASKTNFARMLFGDGTGKLCTIRGINSDGTVNVDSVKNLYEGMCVEVYTSGSINNSVGVAKVKSVDRKNYKVVFSVQNDYFNSGDVVYVAGSKDNELTGLEAIFSTEGTLYGLSKEENSWLVPYTYEMSSPLTTETIQTALDAIEERSGSQPDIIICSWYVRRLLQAHFAENKISSEPMVLDGGYKAMSYNGIPIVVDRFCPTDTMYLLNTKDFKLHQLCDWQWLESDDGKILHKIEGKAAYGATLVKYADLLCERPCGQGKISNIAG